METNLIEEVKILHQSMIKRLFCMKKIEGFDRHPRPLQVSILNYLIEHSENPTSQKDLENHFNISKAAISDALKSMERNGMITRTVSDSDARKNIIYPSKESLDIHAEMVNNMNTINKQLLGCLSEEEIQSFLSITNKLINYMKEGI